jgi:hypothetical protein
VENNEETEEVPQVPFLLSVNQNACDLLPEHENIIMVNADAMSSISWLWLVSPEKPLQKPIEKEADDRSVGML